RRRDMGQRLLPPRYRLARRRPRTGLRPGRNGPVCSNFTISPDGTVTGNGYSSLNHEGDPWMRTLLPTFGLLLLAAPAFAGSIETMPATTSSSSISTVRCDACPALKPKAETSTYHVDAIAPGTQKIEIRE